MRPSVSPVLAGVPAVQTVHRTRGVSCTPTRNKVARAEPPTSGPPSLVPKASTAALFDSPPRSDHRTRDSRRSAYIRRAGLSYVQPCPLGIFRLS